MAANLITKLVLQDAEFAKKLEKNKKQVSAFGKGGAQAFGTVASVVGKFAAGVGVAMGGVEAFNKVMNSSQTLADSWGGVVEAAKTTVDSFFYSISNGDWTPFLGGLDGVISRAKAAYAALDDLGNVSMSYNYAQAQDQAKLTGLLNTARDESAAVGVRAMAMKEAQVLAKQMQKDAAEYNKSTREAYLKQLGSKVGVADTSIFTAQMLDKALRLDINADRGKLREQLAGSKAAYDAEIAGLEVKKETLNIYGQKDVTWEKVADYEERVAEIQQRYADTLVQWAALEVATDDQLRGIGQAVIAGENAVRNAANAERTLQRAEKQVQAAVMKAAEGMTAPGEADITPVGIDYASFAAREGRGKKGVEGVEFPEELGEIPVYTIPEEAKKSVQEYADEVDRLGNAFGQLGSAIGGTEGAMIEWLGQAVSAAAQVAETISLLSAESAAHTANANAAATDAAAKAMAANAGIPIAGVAMGIAAVASIISVLSSIPKFATGGIVTGPTVGLVGEAGPEAIIPLNKLDKMVGGAAAAREVRVVGTLKARGKDLVGTISNFNSAQNVYG